MLTTFCERVRAPRAALIFITFKFNSAQNPHYNRPRSPSSNTTFLNFLLILCTHTIIVPTYTSLADNRQTHFYFTCRGETVFPTQACGHWNWNLVLILGITINFYMKNKTVARSHLHARECLLPIMWKVIFRKN